jgi:hypothetical protein
LKGLAKSAMPGSWRRRSKFTSRKFKPYALASGQLNLAWNDLHEVLGEIFVDAMALRHKNVGLRVKLAVSWGVVASDRQRRVLLKATINRIGRAEHQAFPQLAEDVIWIVGRGDSLEEKRNNVIHAPLSQVVNARPH